MVSLCLLTLGLRKKYHFNQYFSIKIHHWTKTSYCSQLFSDTGDTEIFTALSSQWRRSIAQKFTHRFWFGVSKLRYSLNVLLKLEIVGELCMEHQVLLTERSVKSKRCFNWALYFSSPPSLRPATLIWQNFACSVCRLVINGFTDSANLILLSLPLPFLNQSFLPCSLPPLFVRSSARPSVLDRARGRIDPARFSLEQNEQMEEASLS